MGEPAGIGPDVTLLAWRARSELALPPFYCLADPAVLRARAVKMGIDVPIEVVTPADVADMFDRAPEVGPAAPVGAIGLAHRGERRRLGLEALRRPGVVADLARFLVDEVADLGVGEPEKARRGLGKRAAVGEQRRGVADGADVGPHPVISDAPIALASSL